ncbi:MAG: Sfum_1244 family protein, partial [Pseudomonadota bacterium]
LLQPLGLVYSAGMEGCARAHFYLAELESEERQADGLTIRISGRELARGLSAPVAMTRERSIYLRREALRRHLWEHFEIWRWSSAKNALAKAYAGYDMQDDVEAALSLMADRELETVRQHELGEYLAGEIVGDSWNRMLMELAHTPAELMARAVRDHLADCATTLPYLLSNRRSDSIHLFIGSLSGMRKQIFPALQGAYERWAADGGSGELLQLASRGKEHWHSVALQMCDAWQQSSDDSAVQLTRLVERNYL